MSTMNIGVESLGVEALTSLSAAAAAAVAAGNVSANSIAPSEQSSTSSPQYQQTFTAESSRCTTPMSEAGHSDDDHESTSTTQWDLNLNSYPLPVTHNNDDDDADEDDDEEDSGSIQQGHHLANNQLEDSKLAQETLALLKSEPFERLTSAVRMRNSSNDSATLVSLQNQMLQEQMENFHSKQKELKEKNKRAKLSQASSTTPTITTPAGLGSGSLNRSLPKRSSHSNIVVPNVQESQRHEFQQLLLEYRQVLLDVLSKSFISNKSNETDTDTAMRLPLQCQCGFNSKISNQVTRTANYVHQLELKYRSFVEPTREKELKYTPKRPSFISGSSYPPFGQMDSKPPGTSMLGPARESPSSMLMKSQKFRLAPNMSALGQLNKQQLALMAQYLGQSGVESMSLASSLNGDEEDIDSGEEEPINGNHNNEMLDEMNNVIPSSKGPKTILEDYLEKNMSIKNVPHHDEDEMDLMQNVVQAQQQSFLPQPEVIVSTPKFNTKMKAMIVTMYKQGIAIGTIAKALKTSKKAIRKVIMQDTHKTDKQNQSASLLASMFNNNGLLMPVKRKISSIDDEDLLGDGSNADKSDDEGSHDEHESLLQSMNTGKFPLSFGSQAQSHSSGQLSNGKPSSLSGLLSANVFNGLEKNALAAQINRSILNNPALFQQMKQSFKKNEQQQQQPQPPNIANLKANFDMLSQRLSKSKSIVPGVQRNSMDWNQYSPQSQPNSQQQSQQQQQQQQQQYKNLGTSLNNSAIGVSHSPQIFKKDKKLRLSEPSTIKIDAGLIEADRNNNTTFNNCNASDSGSANDGTPPKQDPNAPLPPLPPGLIGDEDQETVLVPREFHDGVLPAQMMNSLNPNRATKLTLEDFNVVWQLRSQHWTHNQIRKYFEQRGKSISKSSISRIMNGKQRNFQAYFSVVPSKNDS